MVDFHAAHERHIFDELMKRGPARESQDLMFPVVMELPAGDFGSIMDNLGIFSEIGFDIGEFSDNSITIRAVPAVMGRLDEKEFIREVLDSIKQERGHDGIQRALAASAACHSARRSGDSISRDEAVKILDRIFSGRQELRCPHGRPFVQTLKKDDIERIFKRQ
jgi:DNA mismatch repair protein MutL